MSDATPSFEARTPRTSVAGVGDVGAALASCALGAHVRALALADPLALPEIHHRLRHEHFVWDAHVAGKRRVDLHPLVLSPEAHADAVAAALVASRAVGHVAARALVDAEEAAHYRLGPVVTRLAEASRAGGDHASLERVDLLLREDGTFVACEVNADCPGGLNEAVGLPSLLKHVGCTDVTTVTTVVDALADRLVAASGGPGSPKGVVALVFATAYAEDLQVCALVERAVRARGGVAVRTPPTALAVHDGRCLLGGKPVAVLYRFYPTEHFADLPIAAELPPLLASGALTSLSSFVVMYAQSKVAFARVHARLASLPGALAAAAAARLPETRSPLDVPGLEQQREGWVLKKALGRVGDEVFVGALETDDEWARLVSGVKAACLQGEPWVAQRFVRQKTVSTPWGPRYLTLGAYLLDGAFVGYFSRVTEVSHTSHDALVLPVVVRGAGAAP